MTSAEPEVPGDLHTEFFENSCSTVSKMTKFRYKWSIYDFSTYCELYSVSKIESSIFPDDIEDGLKWQIECNSNGWNKYGKDEYLTIRLKLLSDNISDLWPSIYRMSILNGELKEVHSAKAFHLWEHGINFPEIAKSTLLKPKNLLLPNNTLTILCEIVILGSNENVSSKLAMPNDVGLVLFENPDVSVVTFSVDGRELHSLKAILVAKSPVFAAMFSHDTKERQSSQIKITDVDYEVLREMLRFLYTNKISHLKKVARRLLIVAGKYQLDNLKSRCEQSLSENLTIENVAGYFVLANQYNAAELKIKAKAFITANSQDVVKSVEFKSLFVEHPQVFKNLGFFV